MIGGPPILAQPITAPYAAPYAPPAYAAAPPPGWAASPYPAVQPASWPAVPSMPAAARLPAPPKVRAQMPDETTAAPAARAPRATLRLPPPEQLGLLPAASDPKRATAEATAQDWGAAHRRLQQLGAICYHSDRLSDGYRFTCLLPTAARDLSHRVEAQAGTEAEAVSLVLDKAEEWTRAERDVPGR